MLGIHREVAGGGLQPGRTGGWYHDAGRLHRLGRGVTDAGQGRVAVSIHVSQGPKVAILLTG
jgi:hypothetical protein